jgi:cytidylate kinase
MCKWIVTDVGLKCVIIVNKLNANKTPTDVLRIVWNMTNEIFMMMSKTKEIDNTELEKIRERDYNVLQKIKMAQKRLSEMKRNVVSMSQIAK